MKRKTKQKSSAQLPIGSKDWMVARCVEGDEQACLWLCNEHEIAWSCQRAEELRAKREAAELEAVTVRPPRGAEDPQKRGP